MPRDLTLQAAFHFSHELGAWALAGLAVGHAAAALFHHFVLRDDVLESMAPVIAMARPKQELARRRKFDAWMLRIALNQQ
jgi:hypothetical protein